MGYLLHYQDYLMPYKCENLTFFNYKFPIYMLNIFKIYVYSFEIGKRVY